MKRYNHLKNETSPYLKAHATDIVNWYPWSEAAFLAAKSEQKPVFLSSGYSTCHWCHVMSDESFNDPIVGAYLNAHFIAIKVDREERPDIDSLYLKVCQILTGTAGWPLNVFLTSTQQPFYAATYLPKVSEGSRPDIMSVLRHLKRMYEEKPVMITDIGHQLVADLERSSKSEPLLEPLPLQRMYRSLLQAFDVKNGGFGAAPKYPTSAPLRFLMAYQTAYADVYSSRMVIQTLDAWKNSALYDQLEYGFFRYSSDSRYRMPHFEKMLYDQALLLEVYIEAYEKYRLPRYQKVARQMLQFIDENFKQTMLYASAIDADSNQIEGDYYTWTLDEVLAVLGVERGVPFAYRYGIKQEGDIAGENILYINEAETDLTAVELRECRDKLVESRRRRTAPYIETQQKTGWNALMIKAIAKTGRVLQAEVLINQAIQQFKALYDRSYKNELYAIVNQGVSGKKAYLEDYAYFISLCIEMHQSTYQTAYLEIAIRLAAELCECFEDKETGGFFYTAEQSERLVVREKDGLDTALPNANAVIAITFVQITQLTGDEKYAQLAEKAFRFFSGDIERYGLSATSWGSYLIAQDKADTTFVFQGKEVIRKVKTLQKYQKMTDIWQVYETEGPLRLQICYEKTCRFYNEEAIKDYFEKRVMEAMDK
ncbi:thioredoxin domain-containing protein [Brochothrix campestris]|uniref:Spermatogenesis-associated protein 20-like TRX domain-containing protein n=1 Tax=Brochothrix campestris FSL F6-1037 TaxID=1265861 RepID=W7CTE2_9LIST|nr:thioredoxin domain-containing protein [Brochothrix campestris]EUJ40182.1 hypothetical protein BCAMP_05826 [Brochothrix campestris FSL F6-1037]